MNRITSILGASTLILGGCASVNTMEVALPPSTGPVKVECVAVEARTSMFNTQGAIVCRYPSGAVAGMTGGPGAPTIHAVTTAVEAAATLVGGALIGEGLKNIGIDAGGSIDLPVTFPDLPPLP